MHPSDSQIDIRNGAQEALRKSEEKFRLIAETIEAVFWMSTPGIQEMIYVSPAYETIWGRTRESLYQCPQSFMEAVHPEDLERVRAGVEGHAQGRWDFDYRIVQPNGSVRWIRDRGFPILDSNGKLERMTGIATDITELYQAEEASRESEQRFRLVFEGAPIGMAIVGMDYRLQKVNKSLCDLLDYSEEELLSRTFIDITHPEDIEKDLELARKLFRAEIPAYKLEKRCIAKQGEIKWIHLTAALVRDQKGRALCGLAMMENVTERKKAEEMVAQAQRELEERVRDRTAALEAANRELRIEIAVRMRAEEALRDSEERLRRLLETTNALPWEANADTWQFTYVGPQAAKLLGYPIEKWYEDDFWPVHIHPEDRNSAVEFCRWKSRTATDYDFEYRMFSSDGRTVWLHDLVSVERVNGVPKTLRGFMIDVTERKEAELLRAELAGRLLAAQEEERRRLAHELHDDLSQRLSVLSIEAGKLEGQLDSSPDSIHRTIGRMKEQLVALSTDVHALSRQLHPTILDDLGLVDALESECAKFAEREGIQVDFSADDVPVTLPRDVSLCLYRLTQEALRNIAKHAQAKQATVTLSAAGGCIQLSIQDCGVGFDWAAIRGKGGLGLASMGERARLIQGSLRINTQPGQGTTIRVVAPLSGRIQ